MLDYLYDLAAPRRHRREPVRRGRIARRQDQCIYVGFFEGDLAGGYIPPPGYGIVRDGGNLYYCPAGVQPSTPEQTGGEKKPKPKPKQPPKPKWNLSAILATVDKIFNLPNEIPLQSPEELGITTAHTNTLHPKIQPGPQEQNRRKGNDFGRRLLTLGVDLFKAGAGNIQAEANRIGLYGDDGLGSLFKRVIVDRTPTWGGERTVGQIYIETYELWKFLQENRGTWLQVKDHIEPGIEGLRLVTELNKGNVLAVFKGLRSGIQQTKPYFAEKLGALHDALKMMPLPPDPAQANAQKKSIAEYWKDAKTSAKYHLDRVAKGSQTNSPPRYKDKDAWEWSELPPKVQSSAGDALKGFEVGSGIEVAAILALLFLGART